MGRKSLTPRPNGASVAKTSTPDPALVDDPNASDVDRFIAAHPEPILDAVERPLVRAIATEEQPADAPVVEAPQLDSQGEPVVETPPVEAAPAIEAAAPAAPAAEAKPVEPVAPVVEAAKPPVEPAVAVVEPKPVVFDPHEKFALGPDIEWTREQLVTRLQEYQALMPRAEEVDKYRQLFQFPDYAKTAEQWAPVLQILREQPDKTKFFDTVLKADKAKLDYLADSSAFWDSKVAAGEIAPPTVAEKPPTIDVTKDPQVAEALSYIAREKAKAGSARGKREWNDAFDAYPFLRSDNSAREALKSLANALYDADSAKGVDDLECRGVAAAVELNKALYDARMVVMNRQDAAVAAVPSASIPAALAEPILGSQGPAPTARQPRAKIYKGEPDNAVAAFVKDYPS